MIKILLRNQLTPEQCARAKQLAELELIDWASFEADPARATEVEIVFGAPTPEMLARARRLRWVQVISAGVDNIVTPEFLATGARLTSARGMHAVPVTETVFALLLAHVRKFPLAVHNQAAGTWRHQATYPPLTTLEGRTLGVLGLGAIGAQVARVARALRMRVTGLNRGGRNDEPEIVERVYREEERLAFFGACDVIVNLLPLTPATRGSVNAEAFAAMREGAIYLSAGRGATTDTAALVAGLELGRPGAALLDVTDPEPLPVGHPLWTHPNVIITPHIGGLFGKNEERGAEIFLKNLVRFIKSAPLLNEVDLATYEMHSGGASGA